MVRLFMRLVCAVITLLPAEGHANHDSLPDPPPEHTSQKLIMLSHPDRTAVTVSGLSSGGFFAHQFHIAFSNLIKGAGIIAGGPYGCVENIPNPWTPFWSMPLDRVSAAVVACTHYYGERYYGLRPSPPRAEDSLRIIREAANQGLIDNPSDLAGSRVWLFHGKSDALIPLQVMETLRRLYNALGVRGPNLQFDQNQTGSAANHGIPVNTFAGESKFPVRNCGQHASPFVIQCGYEAAEMLLRHLYPDGFKPASDDPHRDGTLVAFDQSEFFDTADASVSLHGVGYLYVPNSCSVEQCRVHVAFHGCNQNVDSVYDDFIRDAGYDRWAASNNIVVLYPQTKTSAANPNRCWDFWGYSGSNYYTRNGPQMRAIKAMIDRLIGQSPQ
ncbi:extracellular catalytic domain type 2 short-chain-length polyhydroxyalkanoate depolymerase [Microvirga yunnanensis]|uniref:extracellular catalytic domain type 2 short-chain-length polyhydroxyalkanoate depolymerase n=1 Tax=Microvirga yunnanensis TaxID=2953740 RepID=UPI0021C88AED|nr:PHB depolymerase family esterase [Microvirga sp. HBU65207]